MAGPTNLPLPEPPLPRTPIVGVLLRAGLFLLFVRILGGLFGWVLLGTTLGPLGIFAAASISTLIVLRTFERANFIDVGLAWGQASSRHFLFGMVAGIAPALAVVLPFVVFGYASFEASTDPAAGFALDRFAVLFALLLFAAIGEELLFRGYAFQLVLNIASPALTILPFAALFALMHANNPHASSISLLNTFVWGVVLGCAYLRAGDLWLPIGIHFGWNLAMPLLGTQVSGLALPVTGYSLIWKVPDFVGGGPYGPEGGVVATVAGSLVLLWLVKAKIEKQPTALWVSSNQDEE